MEFQCIKDSLRALGKLFENYRQINPEKIKKGYPKELKNRLLFLIKNGAKKRDVLEITKISPPTLSTWLSEQEEYELDLPAPKELKVILNHSEEKSKVEEIEKIVEKYCAKINLDNGNSIELTEQGLLLSLKTLIGVK